MLNSPISIALLVFWVLGSLSVLAVTGYTARSFGQSMAVRRRALSRSRRPATLPRQSKAHSLLNGFPHVS